VRPEVPWYVHAKIQDENAPNQDPPLAAACYNEGVLFSHRCGSTVMLRTLLTVLLLTVLLVAIAPSVVSADNIDAPVVQAAETIDRLLQQSWDRQQIQPTPTSNDAEFCRRVWLDLAGVAPPVSQLRAFLADTDSDNTDSDNADSDKRHRLVARLLDSSQYANHMAARWNEVLLPPDAQTQQQQQQNVTALHEWLRDQFRENVRYDYLVGGFLTAGGAGNSGPAIFYTSYGLEPEKLAAATSRIFMGIQLQCAQCHDHPFDRWTQEDFWHYAAFFSQLEQTDMGQNSIIEDRPGREVTLPDTDQVMLPRYPGVSDPPEQDPGDMRRRQLTIWMASRDNPYFVRAAVNRVWAHLFGRGIVDPVDAMDRDNRPSHPELLDFLAGYFVEQRFDLRTLYATLCRTRAYGRSSGSTAGQRPPQESFAAMTVKTLTAEQFYDSMQQNIYRNHGGSSTERMSSDAARRQFLNRMRATGSSPRDYPHGVVQALGMMNGPEINLATHSGQIGLLTALQAPLFHDSDRVETLFLATLSRQPRPEEASRFADHLASAATPQERRAALSDLLWVLLNTAECAVSP
jgi:hypothetical protein